MGVVRLTDKKQMQELLRDLGFNWDVNDVMAVLRKIDLDHSDTIDFREFYQWYVHIIKYTFVSCFSGRAFGFARVFNTLVLFFWTRFRLCACFSFTHSLQACPSFSPLFANDCACNMHSMISDCLKQVR
jgi:hypothetical protein